MKSKMVPGETKRLSRVLRSYAEKYETAVKTLEAKRYKICWPSTRQICAHTCKSNMTLTYIFHSGFVLETEQSILVFDYWMDPSGVMDGVLRSEKPMYVFSSHFHEDHFTKEIFEWKKLREGITYILSKDIYKHRRAAQTAAYRGLLRLRTRLRLSESRAKLAWTLPSVSRLDQRSNVSSMRATWTTGMPSFSDSSRKAIPWRAEGHPQGCWQFRCGDVPHRRTCWQRLYPWWPAIHRTVQSRTVRSHALHYRLWVLLAYEGIYEWKEHCLLENRQGRRNYWTEGIILSLPASFLLSQEIDNRIVSIV